MSGRLRCAYFSPLPPERTGIADYSADLLPYLERHMDITLYSRVVENVSRDMASRYRTRNACTYRTYRWNHDVGLFQIGNNLPFHGVFYDIALRYPGIVVLHDRILHHMQIERTIAKGDLAGYAREMGYAEGTDGYRRAARIAQGDLEYPVWTLPLAERLIDSSIGVMVHSAFAAREISARSTETPIKVIAQPMGIPAVDGSFRDRLPWSADSVIFATVGQLTPNKRIDTFLEAVQRVRSHDPRVRALLIGEWRPEWFDLPGTIARLRLQDSVYHVGYVPSLLELSSWIAASDVVVNLRNPTAGETSAGALRALAVGRPVIVYDHGWYSELPDRVSVKVPPGNGAALAHAISGLAGNEAGRRTLSSGCVPYVTEHHSLSAVAIQYADFARSFVE